MEGFAQIDVVAARAGEHRAQLRVGERTGQGEQAADDPSREDQPRMGQPIRDRAGREEDP